MTCNTCGGGGDNDVHLTVTDANFGCQDLDTTSDPQTITITNTGTVSATGLIVSVTSPFSIDSGTCTTLAPGASCQIDVTFTPTVVGESIGVISITDGNSTWVGALTGISCCEAVVPALAGCGLLVCPSGDFGCVDSFDTSDAITLTITNASGVPVTVTDLQMTNGAFSLDSPPSLPFTIAPAGTQSLSVIVTTGISGVVLSGSLIVISGAETSPNYIALRAVTCMTGGPMLAMEWSEVSPQIFVVDGEFFPYAPLSMNFVLPNFSNLWGSCQPTGDCDAPGGCYYTPLSPVTGYYNGRVRYIPCGDGCDDFDPPPVFDINWNAGYIFPMTASYDLSGPTPIDDDDLIMRFVPTGRTNVGGVGESHYTNSIRKLKLTNVGDATLTISSYSVKRPDGNNLDGAGAITFSPSVTFPFDIAPNETVEVGVNLIFNALGLAPTQEYGEAYLTFLTNVATTTTTVNTTFSGSDTSFIVDGTSGPRPSQLITITGIFAYYLPTNSVAGTDTTTISLHRGQINGANSGEVVSWGDRFTVSCVTGVWAPK
jgi:hypothetical protein